ncbi:MULTISPECIES: KxYKxGKxW signal peptide domain-containing protein, partial [unclassified Lactococcus]
MRKKQRSKRENLKLKTSEPKLRYRMYKSKKRWLYATISSISILGGGAAGTDLTALASVKDTNASKTNFKLPALKALESDERGKANSVAVDPDSNRPDFENILTDNANNIKSPTSVNVATPDQVINDAQYKAQAQADGTYAAVSTFAELVSAWNNQTIRYIDIQNNIESVDGSNFQLRNEGNDVIIQGNNHTLNLHQKSFGLSNVTSKATTITFTNMKVIQGFPYGEAERGLLDGGASQWGANGPLLTANINNVSISNESDTDSSKVAIHAVNVNYGKAVFSGSNVFRMNHEITRGITKIEVANGASLDYFRPDVNADGDDSVFWFDNYNSNPNSPGYGNTITMGDGSSFDAKAEVGININYPAFYNYTNGIIAGDNVSWTQDGWQRFMHGGEGAAADAKWVFGQNFRLSIPRATQSFSAAYINRNQSVSFAANAVIEVNQWNAGALINVNSASAKVEFTSPKALNFAIKNSTGENAAGRLIQGAGAFTLNNSSVSSWKGVNASPNTPDATGTVGQLTYKNGVTTVTDGTADSSILTSNTRELQTNALSVGEIKLNYVDQRGKTVGSTTIPVSNDLNYIGQTINLVNKKYAIDNMPAGYKWAIGANDETTQISKDVPTGTEGQPSGDGTSTVDNGDQWGQANYAVVPQEGTTNEYNVYVYGDANPNVSYTYIDVISGLPVSSSSNQVGSEIAGSANVPANVGNTIDWTSELYTKTNVPEGYTYLEDGNSFLPEGVTQPTTTEITDTTTEHNKVIYVFSPEGSESMSVSASQSESSSASGSLSASESALVSQSESGSESVSVSSSESLSASLSASYSSSGSLSTSESASLSISESQSVSQSESQSVSASVSESQSVSASISTSVSQSESTSIIASTSDSLDKSESLSIVISESESASSSESAMVSESASESASTSAELSESSSVSASISASLSDSESSSVELSESESASTSVEVSESESASTSAELSESSSVSDSESSSVELSESESASTSVEVSESESSSESSSVSASISASLSDSESSSVELSESESASTSVELSESNSSSESSSVSASISASLSDSESSSVELSESESASASMEVSESESASTSVELSESESASTSVEVSESESSSESSSVSASISASLSESESNSVEVSESESASTSVEFSESESASTSVELSESESASTSVEVSESESSSESSSVSASISASLSESESSSVEVSESESASTSVEVSESESASTSVEVSESESTSTSVEVSESESSSESSSVSASISASLSDSESSSVELSESESASTSVELSESESASTSVELSESESASTSVELSESESASTSVELSESESASTSVEVSESESVSTSVELSESESASTSVELSESESASTSVEVSESESSSESSSVSASISASLSELESNSVELSESESVSTSVELSESESASTSVEVSESESASTSVEVSESESASTSAEVSESESSSESSSVSASISASLSDSESSSVEVSESESASTSVELSESESASTSVELSESNSSSESSSVSASISASLSE